MKKSDLLNFTITAREALRVYTILHKTNGDVSTDFYKTLKGMLDQENKIASFIGNTASVSRNDYISIQLKLENLAFQDKSESEKQLDNMMEKLAELQKEAEQLQETIKKEKK